MFSSGQNKGALIGFQPTERRNKGVNTVNTTGGNTAHSPDLAERTEHRESQSDEVLRLTYRLSLSRPDPILLKRFLDIWSIL